MPRDGTSAHPFDTLSDALAAAGTGDAIHIRRAAGNGVLTAGVSLQSGQKLIGEGVALTNTGGVTFHDLNLNSSGATPTFQLANAANVTVDGASFSTSVASNGAAAVSANVCADIKSNTIGGSGHNVNIGEEDFRLRQRFNATAVLPGYGGPAADTTNTPPAVVSFIQAQNTGSETGSASAAGTGGGFVGTGTACTQPTP